MMDMKEQVGQTAGKVWQALSTGGPQTATQLKKNLDGSGDLLGLALGWLAREDKVEIIQDKKTLRVKLR